jgi:hypothetical protein
LYLRTINSEKNCKNNDDQRNIGISSSSSGGGNYSVRDRIHESDRLRCSCAGVCDDKKAVRIE